MRASSATLTVFSFLCLWPCRSLKLMGSEGTALGENRMIACRRLLHLLRHSMRMHCKWVRKFWQQMTKLRQHVRTLSDNFLSAQRCGSQADAGQNGGTSTFQTAYADALTSKEMGEPFHMYGASGISCQTDPHTDLHHATSFNWPQPFNDKF